MSTFSRRKLVAVNLMTADPNTQLAATGDVFEDSLESSLRSLLNPEYVQSNSTGPGGAPPSTELINSIINRVKVSPD